MFGLWDPKVDFAFKRLFGSLEYTTLLMALLNALHRRARRRPVTSLQLRNPFSGKEHEDDKNPVYDILVADQDERLNHLEMQGNVPWSFGNRFTYYAARLHGQQLQAGAAYETLQPTISTAILNEVYIADGSYYHRFVLYDAARRATLTEDLDLTLIELPKFDRTARACREPLEQWCYFLKHGHELDRRHLPGQLDQPIFHQAMEVLEMLSQDEIERQRYEDRRKAHHDQVSREYRMKHSRRLGREEGREEGMETGELVGSIRMLQQILRLPQTAREELIAQSADALRKLAQKLEKQLPPQP